MTLITMTHPEIGAVGRATEEAFRMVWEPRGWQRADPVAALAGDVLGVDVVNVDDLTKEQLLELAAAVGAEGSARSTKPELVESIRGHVTPMVEAEAAPVEPAEQAAPSPEPSTGTRRRTKE